MRGDLYRKTEAGWGSPLENIASPPPATIYVPLYGANQPTPSDSDTLALYLFNETSGSSFQNAITSANDLHQTAGTLHLGCVGPFGYPSSPSSPSGAIFTNGYLEDVAIVTTSVGAFEPPTSITLNLWVFLHNYRRATGDGNLLTKPYHPSAWASPYRVVAIWFDSTGVLKAQIVSTAVSVNERLVPLFEWAMLSLTYDGASVKLYVNGQQVSTASRTGVIPWSSGVNACPWVIGEPVGVASAGLDARIGPVWIEQVARSVSDLGTCYKRAAKRF